MFKRAVVKIQAFLKMKIYQGKYLNILKAVITIQVIYVYILRLRMNKRQKRASLGIYKWVRK